MINGELDNVRSAASSKLFNRKKLNSDVQKINKT
jgi:hypothetical protein